MRIVSVHIQNFRKLYRCRIDFSKETTLFVGANNSGKTSAMDAMGKFLKERSFVFNDFTLSNHSLINQIGNEWQKEDCDKPDSLSAWTKLLPSLDIWLNVETQDIHYVISIIPTLKWRGGLLGVRFLFQPANIETLFNDYREAYFAARKTETKGSEGSQLKLFPHDLCHFLERNLSKYFGLKTYVLDPAKANDDPPQEIDFEMECLSDNPLKGIIRVDMISAQRGLSDPDKNVGNGIDHTKLSSQIRGYYDKHLDPEKAPLPEDLGMLEASEDARKAFDLNLENKLRPAIKELETLGYPGVTNPRITITSKVSTTDVLKHDSAVQYNLGSGEQGMLLPEKYNGLGYQNLISIVFDLISFRDGWMRKGKASSSSEIIEPLHLVLVEEPEAHLHAQVQQVFIRKAYSILRNHEKLTNDSPFSTQMVISTHSSHIAKEVSFESLRYFKRLPADKDCLIANSKVINLSDVFGKEAKTDKFVTRYLQTTHCDLFFADGIILVEGSSEAMLLPHFIKNNYPALDQRYITILNINGKHSHRLGPLIDKLALPTLVITDLDSAEPTGHHSKVVPHRNANQISSNYAITGWLIKKSSLDELLDLSDDQKVISKRSICDYQIRIAFQTPIKIDYKGTTVEALSRTFEDSLIYSNWNIFRAQATNESGHLISKLKEGFDKGDSFDKIKTTIFNELKKSDVKAEFALDLIYSIDPQDIVIPGYIDEGLKWIDNILCAEDEDEAEHR